jgi:hypothetical protein
MPESIRSMTFQCWNDYFVKADIVEQSAICQLMIRVVTSFSNWPGKSIRICIAVF